MQKFSLFRFVNVNEGQDYSSWYRTVNFSVVCNHAYSGGGGGGV